MPTPITYLPFLQKQNNGNGIDLDTDTIKIMIVTNSYTPNRSHEFIDDANSFEVSGTNYTAGGPTIAGVTLAIDGTTIRWVHNDITITQDASGFTTGRTLIWYKDTGSASTSPLIMYASDVADFGNVASDLIIDVNPATGVMAIT